MKRVSLYLMLLFILLSSVILFADEGIPYFRQPAISADGKQVAFVYAGDIYLVGAAGGKADLLVSSSNYDEHPSFSPDGKWLAFTSDRTGGGDVYILNLETGETRRLTWQSSYDETENWSKDSKYVYFSSGRGDIARNPDIYKISIEGGNPVAMSRDRFEAEYAAAVSPDGKYLAFNSNDRLRQWWRMGPRVDDATNVWVKSNSPEAMDYKQVTTYEGKDSWPMWAADGKGLYFVTDEGSDKGIENIAYQTLTGERKPVTAFKEGRVLYPDIAANNTIVFEHNFGIWVLPAGGEAAELKIKAFYDDKSNPVNAEVFANRVSNFSLSPDNKKIAYVSHGEIFAAPADVKKGEERESLRITNNPYLETEVVWGKDSNKIYYVSDQKGYSNLYQYDFISKETKQLTDNKVTEEDLILSPDGKWLAFTRDRFTVNLLNTEDNTVKKFAESVVGINGYTWSPDSKYLLVTKTNENYFSNLYAYDIEGKLKPAQLTYLPHGGLYGAKWSEDGKFVIFTTSQSRLESYVMKLDLQPVKPEFKVDEFEKLFEKPKDKEEAKKDTDKDKKAEDQEKESKKPEEKKKEEKLVIVTERIKERLNRMVAFVENPNFVAITPDSKSFLFTSGTATDNVLWKANIDGSGKVQQIGTGRFGQVQFAKDKSTMWYLSGGTIMKLPINGGSPAPVSVKAEMEIDFNQEKLVAFRQAWNLLRDGFVDGEFNGKDWEALYNYYLPYIKGSKTTEDFVAIGNLLQGEMNTSHMGMRSFSGNRPVATADIGLDFDQKVLAESGKLVVSEVIDEGPVSIKDSKVAPGYQLVAIDGKEVNGKTNINELLSSKIGKKLILTFKPSEAEENRDVAIEGVSNGLISQLRYKTWVRKNAEYVKKISNGRLGYVHIPDMGTTSLENFRINLDSEIHASQGVVIDTRYNNGGWVATFIADVLARKVTHFQTFRGRGKTPSAHLVGNYILGLPTVLLQNEQSLSNAENFAEIYRRLGLGKIVGTNSCGWLVFTGGSMLINNVSIRMPSWKNFTVEGENMDRVSRKADVFVDRPIGQALTDKDDQLDKAVEVLLKQIDNK